MTFLHALYQWKEKASISGVCSKNMEGAITTFKNHPIGRFVIKDDFSKLPVKAQKMIAFIRSLKYFNRCWLNVHKGEIWAFAGPAAIILLVSMF